MSMSEVFAEIDAHNKAIVMTNTWGHLYPEPKTTYTGSITFAIASYGGSMSIINSHWDNLEDSPMLYDTMLDVFNQVQPLGSYGVWKWKGKLHCYSNGNCKLRKGIITQIV